MPTSVALPNIIATTKNALYEILTQYFDGTSKSVGGVTLEFPQADIVFDTLPTESISKPIISIIGNTVLNDSPRKIPKPGTATQPGIEVYGMAVRQVIVACPLRGGTNDFNRINIDKIWSALYILFSQWPIFAAQGIIRPVLPMIPSDTFEQAAFVEAHGILEFSVIARFARH